MIYDVLSEPNKIIVLIIFGVLSATGLGVQAQEYYLDPDHTSVIFAVKNFDIGYTYGRFNKTEGEIYLDKSIPRHSTFEFKIASGSVDSNNEARDLYLRGPTMLNAEKFPFIEFVSDDVKYEKRNNKELYIATGIMKIQDKQKQVSLPIYVTGQGSGKFGKRRIGFLAKFNIDRKEFGMEEPSNIGDKIAITFSTEAIQKDLAPDQSTERGTTTTSEKDESPEKEDKTDQG